MKATNMIHTINYNRLIVNYQEGPFSCIPASVELIFKYHKPILPFNQFMITILMINYSINNSPSFSAIENIVCPSITTFFDINVLNPITFNDWLQNIENELINNRPIAISTDMPNRGAHVRVVLSKDDTNKKLTLYNPGFYLKISHVLNKGKITGTIAIYEAGIEEYGYTDAQKDFNASNACHDQLQIIPI